MLQHHGVSCFSLPLSCLLVECVSRYLTLQVANMVIRYDDIDVDFFDVKLPETHLHKSNAVLHWNKIQLTSVSVWIFFHNNFILTSVLNRIKKALEDIYHRNANTSRRNIYFYFSVETLRIFSLFIRFLFSIHPRWISRWTYQSHRQVEEHFATT